MLALRPRGEEVSVARADWTALSDEQLLAQCEVDTYRASGPGGQKRNKTSSAVRVRHPPSGLIVIAEESRSQHENRARALRRLRKAFYLKLREPADGQDAEAVPAAIAGSTDAAGRLRVGARDPRFWPAVGIVLDLLEAAGAQVSTVAARLGISTGNLIDFLKTDDKVWEQVNQIRARSGLKSLK